MPVNASTFDASVQFDDRSLRVEFFRKRDARKAVFPLRLSVTRDANVVGSSVVTFRISLPFNATEPVVIRVTAFTPAPHPETIMAVPV
jgi:hypothetical protein